MTAAVGWRSCDAVVDAILIVPTVAGERGQRARHLVEQGAGLGAVVHLDVPLIRATRLRRRLAQNGQVLRSVAAKGRRAPLTGISTLPSRRHLYLPLTSVDSDSDSPKISAKVRMASEAATPAAIATVDGRSSALAATNTAAPAPAAVT